MLQISPQRSVLRIEFDQLNAARGREHAGRASTRIAVADLAINDKLHAAIAQHRAIRQRVAELHLRLASVCGRLSA